LPPAFRGRELAREMKNSGVDWIGEIPRDWQLVRACDLFRKKKTTGRVDAELLSVYREHGVVPKASRDDNMNRPSDDLSAYQFVKIGDLVLNKMKTWQGSIAVSKHEGIVSPAYYVARPLVKMSLDFVHHLLRSPNYIDRYAALSSGVRVNQWDLSYDDFKAMPVPMPSIGEQRAIADYLDRQTALIDQRLSTLEEKKIVLAELRKATIHEAVTKGLNKSATMKDSGAPSHWTTVRIKDVAKLNPSILLPKLDEIDFFPMEAIGVDGGLSFGQHKAVAQAGGYSQMQNGDVCFAKVTPCFENGKSAIVEGLKAKVALATTEITILRPNKKINRQFLHYRIKGLDFAVDGANEMKGAGGLKRVPERFAADFAFQLPPLSEQFAIANHLDQQTQQIDAQLSTLDEQAQVLKELRKAIIHEAVTGKIDLSGAVSGKEK